MNDGKIMVAVTRENIFLYTQFAGDDEATDFRFLFWNISLKIKFTNWRYVYGEKIDKYEHFRRTFPSGVKVGSVEDGAKNESFTWKSWIL